MRTADGVLPSGPPTKDNPAALIFGLGPDGARSIEESAKCVFRQRRRTCTRALRDGSPEDEGPFGLESWRTPLLKWEGPPTNTPGRVVLVFGVHFSVPESRLARVCVGRRQPQAGTINGQTVKPSSSSCAATVSKPRLTCPRTFSAMTQRGRASRMIRRISGQRWRGSFSPCCFPAAENGWQGYPPQITPTAPKYWLPSNWVTS